MKKIKLHIDNAKSFVDEKKHGEFVQKTVNSAKQLEEKTGLGNDFLGWLELPYTDIHEKVSNFANSFDKEIETVVVIGIGGSYLGARAMISALSQPFEENKTEIIYAGYNLNAE